MFIMITGWNVKTLDPVIFMQKVTRPCNCVEQ